MRAAAVILVLLIVAAFPWAAGAQPGQHYLTGFPAVKQQHGLTCEAAAASMGTREAVTEAQLMDAMPRNPNPYLGFRGNPDGVGGGLVDYGVYAPPLARALARYDFASAPLYHVRDSTLRAYIDRGWPVVVWITYGLKREQPQLAGAGSDRLVLVPFEHVILVTGYNSKTITGNDPWLPAVVHYKWANFNRSWGYFGNMALAIDPCALPSTVSQLHFDAPDLPAAGAVWTWAPGAHDTSYHVRIVEAGGDNPVVYNGTQTATAYTLATARPGHTYQVTVWGMSPCGDASAPVSILSKVPRLEPTPLPPTPVLPTLTPAPTPTPTP